MDITDNEHVELEQDLPPELTQVAKLPYDQLEEQLRRANVTITDLRQMLSQNLTDQQREFINLLEMQMRAQPGSEAYQHLLEKATAVDQHNFELVNTNQRLQGELDRTLTREAELITTSGELSSLLAAARTDVAAGKEMFVQLRSELARIDSERAEHKRLHESAKTQLEYLSRQNDNQRKELATAYDRIRDLETERNAYAQHNGHLNRTMGHLVGALGEWAIAIPPVPMTNLTRSEQEAKDKADQENQYEPPF